MKQRLCVPLVVAILGSALTLALLEPASYAAAPSLAPLSMARARSSSPIPVWVSAREAFNSDGELRPELFSGADLSLLNKHLRRNAGSDCIEYLGAPPLEDFTSKDSLDAIISSALTIIEGRVVTTDVGFYNGVPGTLVVLSVGETYKALGRVAAKGPIDLFVGEATIPTRTGSICSKTFSHVPTPRIGDDVVVFASIDPLDVEQRILVVDERTQFIVQRDARVYMGVPTARGCCGDFHELGSSIRENQHLHDAPARVRQ